MFCFCPFFCFVLFFLLFSTIQVYARYRMLFVRKKSFVLKVCMSSSNCSNYFVAKNSHAKNFNVSQIIWKTSKFYSILPGSCSQRRNLVPQISIFLNLEKNFQCLEIDSHQINESRQFFRKDVWVLLIFRVNTFYIYSWLTIS